jgi:hypothetical protein
MAKITFYHQKRRDGGIRTGVEINGETELGLEEEFTGKEIDPVLLWFVDLRCEGKKLPTDAEAVRAWLLEQSSVIRAGLESLAGEIRAGIDFNTFPYLWPVPGAPRGVRMMLACSAMRRTEARSIRDVLVHLAAHWQERVARLPAVERA